MIDVVTVWIILNGQCNSVGSVPIRRNPNPIPNP